MVRIWETHKDHFVLKTTTCCPFSYSKVPGVWQRSEGLELLGRVLHRGEECAFVQITIIFWRYVYDLMLFSVKELIPFPLFCQHIWDVICEIPWSETLCLYIKKVLRKTRLTFLHLTLQHFVSHCLETCRRWDQFRDHRLGFNFKRHLFESLYVFYDFYIQDLLWHLWFLYQQYRWLLLCHFRSLLSNILLHYRLLLFLFDDHRSRTYA